MKWKAFKDELPEEGRLILYGNYRFVKTMKYNPAHPDLDEKIAYKPITHWLYIDLPPIEVEKDEWTKT